MKIGFTGSRQGMSSSQRGELLKYLNSNMASEFHHGMCKGSDIEAHEIAKFCGLYIIGHPPRNPSQVIRVKCHETRIAEDYLVRNHAIVNETDLLIVAPSGPEIIRSGTWSTKRYAEKVGKNFIILERG